MKILNPQLYNDLCAIEDLLIEKGWCKGISESEEGAHCLHGAITEVLRGKESRYSRYTVAGKILRKHLPDNSIVNFNDNPETTFEDILACIRTARKELTE